MGIVLGEVYIKPTPLFYAVYRRDLDEVTSILKDPEQRSMIEEKCSAGGSSWTPLQWACKNHLTKIAIALVESGANITKRTHSEKSLLHLSCANAELSQYLLSKGVSRDAVNMKARTALHYACYSYNNIETVKLLIENGLDVNAVDARECTALHYAACIDDVEVLKLLIENGATVDSKTIDGETALHLVLSGWMFEAVQLLVKSGASVNEKK